MPETIRNFVPCGCYFFTVTLADRSSSLLTGHIDRLRDAVCYVKLCHPFTIDAWVVLPEHLHAMESFRRAM